MSLVCKECGDEIEIKKYDKGMSCFTCKYHIKKMINLIVKMLLNSKLIQSKL